MLNSLWLFVWLTDEMVNEDVLAAPQADVHIPLAWHFR